MYKLLTVILDQFKVSLLNRLFIVLISLQKINVIDLKHFNVRVNKADIKLSSQMSEAFEHSHCSMPVSFIALPTSLEESKSKWPVIVGLKALYGHQEIRRFPAGKRQVIG